MELSGTIAEEVLLNLKFSMISMEMVLLWPTAVG
jgi:hypothetical protein